MATPRVQGVEYPWHRLDLPWADALLDARNPDAHAPLPDRLPDPVPDRTVTVDGWTCAAYVVAGGRKGGSTSVLTLIAPDGWTGAVALPQFSGRRFAYVALSETLPYLGRLVSPGNSTQRRLDRMREMAAAGFPMLRAALQAPHEWDGSGYRDPEYAGDLNSYLLLWASSGVEEADAAVLSDHQVRVVTPADSTPGLLDWLDAGYTAHTTAQWREVGCRTPAEAATLAKFGFTPEIVSRWEQTPFPARQGPRATWALHDAGWTPRAVCTLASDVIEQDATTAVTFYSLVKKWARVMRPAEASRFIEMGVGLDGAKAMQSRGESIDPVTFTVMVAMRPDRSQTRYLSEPQRGRPASPYHRPTMRRAVTAEESTRRYSYLPTLT